MELHPQRMEEEPDGDSEAEDIARNLAMIRTQSFRCLKERSVLIIRNLQSYAHLLTYFTIANNCLPTYLSGARIRRLLELVYDRICSVVNVNQAIVAARYARYIESTMCSTKRVKIDESFYSGEEKIEGFFGPCSWNSNEICQDGTCSVGFRIERSC
jgi:hypothetical protein